QISLQYDSSGTWRHTCGGTLIDPSWWLWAWRRSSCTRSGTPSSSCRGWDASGAGGEHRGQGPLSSQLGSPCSNDIALIKLAQAVKESETIQPSCLPPAGLILENGYPCYITGWGRLRTNGPLADTLQQALLPVVSYEICSQRDWWGSNVRTTMVCAGGDGVTSGCNGDSGGPLNCQREGLWEVHGIVSFGSALGCNTAKK
ncbi:CTRC protein, partial [Ciccaba nigrolineata]|nr:CTRC protein [Ciccaba nigrolineata]